MNDISQRKINSTGNSEVLSISLPNVCLAIWVAHAFLFNIIANSLPTEIFPILTMFFAVMYHITNRFIVKKLTLFDIHFIICLCLIIVGYFKRPQPSTMLDILTFLSGYLVVRTFSNNSKRFITSLRIMTIFGIFFSIGVFLSYFLPAVYDLSLALFPSNFVDAIRSTKSANLRIQGFTTNPGHAAAFIVMGLLSCFAKMETFKGNRKDFFLIIFMAFSLLLTGKRAHALFAFITIILGYLLPMRGQEKMKRYWRIFILFAVVSVIVVVSWDYLIAIPFFARLQETISGILAGEDVSSSRSALSAWALILFRRNPIAGIGWNTYRTTVVGNATKITELDVHNIYLQLLCETGIIGFIIFVCFFMVQWIYCKNAYKEVISREENKNSAWCIALKFSFIFQTFFLLYGLTGNPLYDQSWQMIYMLSIAITMSYRFKSWNNM